MLGVMITYDWRVKNYEAYLKMKLHWCSLYALMNEMNALVPFSRTSCHFSRTAVSRRHRMHSSRPPEIIFSYHKRRLVRLRKLREHGRRNACSLTVDPAPKPLYKALRSTAATDKQSSLGLCLMFLVRGRPLHTIAPKTYMGVVCRRERVCSG